MDARIHVVMVARPVVAHRLQTMVDQAAVTAVVAPVAEAGCFPVSAAEDAAMVAVVPVAAHPAIVVAQMAAAEQETVAAERAMDAAAAVVVSVC